MTSVNTAVLTCFWSDEWHGSLLCHFFNQFKDQVKHQCPWQVTILEKRLSCFSFYCFPKGFTYFWRDSLNMRKIPPILTFLLKSFVKIFTQRLPIYPWFFSYVPDHLSQNCFSFSSLAVRLWRESSHGSPHGAVFVLFLCKSVHLCTEHYEATLIIRCLWALHGWILLVCNKHLSSIHACVC